MQMIKQSLEAYKQSKRNSNEEMKDEETKTQSNPFQAQNVAMTPQQPGQVAPQVEEKKVDPAEERRNQILARFKNIIEADKKKMSEMDEQNAPSRAYSSLCSFTTSKTLTQEEEKLSAQDYFADKQKKLSQISAQRQFRDQVRKNVIVGGKFPQAKVEEVMVKIPDIPQDLVKAYLEMQKSCIKFRLSEDADFKMANQPNAPNSES